MNEDSGVRDILMELAFGNGRPGDVLRWAGRDARDITPSVMFGRALALFRIGDCDRATLHLRAALLLHPSVARGLFDSVGPRPERAVAGIPAWGSPEEVSEYRERFGRFWAGDALEWLRRMMEGSRTDATSPFRRAGRVTQKNTTTRRIIGLILNDPHTTRRLLSENLNISENCVKYHLKRLRRAGRIRRVGPDRGGRWEVVG